MADKPNILLIVSDDHGYADRSRLGIHPDVVTPGLDRLAEGGVECDQAYVTAPICSPSRAGLITGQYQNRWGVEWFGSSRFPDHRPTMAEVLAEQGYSTAYLGKVHYGPEDIGDRATPPHHGFQETFYGLAGKQMGRLNYMVHSKEAVEEYGEYAAHVMAVQPMLEGDEEVPLERFLTAELGDRARAFMTRTVEEKQPFFLMLAFNAVHNFCWQLPREELEKRGLPVEEDFKGTKESYLDWYDGQVAPNLEHGRDYYLVQLELMDKEINSVLDTLDELGVADDTLVVYMTDNGGSNCNHASNIPLNGTKYTLYEGGIRVPFLLRWPNGGLPAGERSRELISSMDIMPTLMAAAGCEQDLECDGQNLLPVLIQGGRGHERLHWDNGFQWAVRDGDWKLNYVDRDSAGYEGILKIEHTDMGETWRLYNLEEDPGETNNLAEQMPEQVERLKALHEEWRAEMKESAKALAEASN